VPGYAIAEATKAASQENQQFVVHQFGPPRNRVKYPSLQEIAEACIGPDEVISEGEAMRRLEKYGILNDPRITINGSTAAIIRMVDAFPIPLWMWSDWKAGTLKRFRPEPKPFVRNVFTPVEPVAPAARSMRNEIRELRQQLTGSPEVPFISVGEGHVLIINRSKAPAQIHAFRFTFPSGAVQPGQIVEVDADTSRELTHTGILEEISVSDAQDLIASFR
jgi:hypothetical protein